MNRPRSIRRWWVGVVSAVLILVPAGSAAAAEPGHVLVADEAQVWMSATSPYDACIEWSLWLSVLDGDWKQTAPGGQFTDLTRAAVSWQTHNVCTDQAVADFYGEVELTSEDYSLDVYGGAQLDVTVPVEWIGYIQAFTFHLTWTPTSRIHADTWTPLGPGERQVFTYVDAEVSGTVENWGWPQMFVDGPWGGTISRLTQVGTPIQ